MYMSLLGSSWVNSLKWGLLCDSYIDWYCACMYVCIHCMTVCMYCMCVCVCVGSERWACFGCHNVLCEPLSYNLMIAIRVDGASL